jgi:hypothetical protein
MNLQTIFNQAKENTLLLPDFQRNFVWSRDKQRRLLSSVFLGFPIGSTLTLEGNRNDYALRKLRFTNQINEANGECIYLLDGQQRIATLFNAFSDVFSQEACANTQDVTSILSSIFSPLKSRWFFTVHANNDEHYDFFGYNELLFVPELLGELEPAEIESLFISKDFNESNRKHKDRWFSPYYIFNHDIDNILRTDAVIANSCANEGLLPLFSISSLDNNPLHVRVLHALASRKVDQLRQQTQGNIEEVRRLLLTADPTDTLLEITETTDQRLNDLWYTLRHNWINAVKAFLDGLINNYSLPTLLTEDVRRAIPIFQEMNMGGVKLSDYDLVVAKASKRLHGEDEPYSLGTIINNFVCAPINLPESVILSIQPVAIRPNCINLLNLDIIKDDAPEGLFKKSLLNILSILTHEDRRQELGLATPNSIVADIKSSQILSLTPQEIRANIGTALTAVSRALSFLHIRCGIVKAKDLHYELMILPIAYLMQHDDVWENVNKLNKIEYWYWSSFLGGSYLYQQNQVAINDIGLLYGWVRLDEINPFLNRRNDVFTHERYSSFNTLTGYEDSKPSTAIHKGILQYVLSTCPIDLLPTEQFRLTTWRVAEGYRFIFEGDSYELVLHDHHIYPLAGAVNIGESTRDIRDSHVLNSPLNRTYISSIANRRLGPYSPQDYLNDLTPAIRGSHKIPAANEYLNMPENTQQAYLDILRRRFDDLHAMIDQELETLIA